MSSEEAGEAVPGEVVPGEAMPGEAVPGETAAGGADELRLTDPRAMRAMAHPVRIALLELLVATPTLTATQASEVLGESPANCAFHLRTLAKYGFVREAGGGKGRERPWTAVHRSIDVGITRQPDRQSEQAATALTQAWLERTMEYVRRTLAANSWPDGWDDAVIVREAFRYLTPEETTRVAAEIDKILEPYRGRLHDRASRPAGALPVRTEFIAFPDPGLAALAALPADADTSETE
jgi:hypothetical protein